MAATNETTHPNKSAFPPGVSGPALRALNGAGIRSVADLSRWREADLAALHGMGPKALSILKEALAASGRRFIAALVLLVLPLAKPATAHAQHSMSSMSGMSAHDHITIPAGALYTIADIEFMQGMIAHHAQAIYMSRMAESHHASARLLKLANKIDQSQVSEIRIMQDWLRRNGQVAPDTSSWRTMTMTGMLSAEQLALLDASTGDQFDRAFLTLMIQHHEGALRMVKDLLATPRAGQDVDVNVFANDVVSVQTAEIGAMRRMLSQLPDR
jgi:uncharacterized protein (DUF305 family)